VTSKWGYWMDAVPVSSNPCVMFGVGIVLFSLLSSLDSWELLLLLLMFVSDVSAVTIFRAIFSAILLTYFSNDLTPLSLA